MRKRKKRGKNKNKINEENDSRRFTLLVIIETEK